MFKVIYFRFKHFNISDLDVLVFDAQIQTSDDKLGFVVAKFELIAKKLRSYLQPTVPQKGESLELVALKSKVKLTEDFDFTREQYVKKHSFALMMSQGFKTSDLNRKTGWLGDISAKDSEEADVGSKEHQLISAKR